MPAIHVGTSLRPSKLLAMRHLRNARNARAKFARFTPTLALFLKVLASIKRIREQITQLAHQILRRHRQRHFLNRINRDVADDLPLSLHLENCLGHRAHLIRQKSSLESKVVCP